MMVARFLVMARDHVRNRIRFEESLMWRLVCNLLGNVYEKVVVEKRDCSY